MKQRIPRLVLLGALRALVLKEKDAPPTPVPVREKAAQKQGSQP